MKKYLLLFITVLSVSLTACSSDDEYCDSRLYRSPQLEKVFGFHPDQFIVNGLKGDSFIVIRSEREFQDKVRGAHHYRGVIDFRRDELIIGQTYVDRFDAIIDIVPLYKESCNYYDDNLLEVELLLNKGYRFSDYITYHTIVPKSRNDRYNVITTVRYR